MGPDYYTKKFLDSMYSHNKDYYYYKDDYNILDQNGGYRKYDNIHKKELKKLELYFENGNYKFSQETVMSYSDSVDYEMSGDHYFFSYVLAEDETIEDGEEKILREFSRVMKEEKKEQTILRKETEKRHKRELLELETDDANYKKEFLLLNKLRRKDKLLKILGEKI